jgi:hypothetical protein
MTRPKEGKMDLTKQQDDRAEKLAATYGRCAVGLVDATGCVELTGLVDDIVMETQYVDSFGNVLRRDKP